MTAPASVRIVEVGARDGLQNEAAHLSPAVRAEFVRRLAAAGATTIEAGAFVRPDAVPQMAGTAEVLAALTDLDVRLPVLVPNERGMRDAIDAGATEVAVFLAASESFSQANTNASIADSIARTDAVFTLAGEHDIAVRGYVSTVIGCPFEGRVLPDAVLPVAKALLERGASMVSLGDTIGVGTVTSVRSLLDACGESFGLDQIAVHFHDTYGQGLANTLAAIAMGVAEADVSAGGLGGCPFAPGATGNLATEDLVYALDAAGIETGIDLQAYVDVSAWMAEQLGRPSPSRVVRAALAKRA